MARFVVNAQLPPALARMISDLGHEAEHVYDFTMESASDSEIWDYALNVGAIIVTKDEDFVARSNLVKTAPPIIWVRTGNLTKQALLTWFRPLFPEIVAKIQSGERLVELA
jgi:predicted nuclease of predicted toxin-antitoxin system